MITVVTSALIAKPAPSTGSRSFGNSINGDEALAWTRTNSTTPDTATPSSTRFARPKRPRPIVIASA